MTQGKDGRGERWSYLQGAAATTASSRLHVHLQAKLEGDQHTDDGCQRHGPRQADDGGAPAGAGAVLEERGVERAQLGSLGDGGLDVLERRREVGCGGGGGGLD
jgi:hypothetical protein